jgi:hypothetical protein
MPYYHDLITNKSWQVLQKLSQQLKFILIGGWAVWLYTNSLKSKDIDVILSYEELDKMRKKYEIFKNDRLKKCEMKIEEISIDIYLPFYSSLGIPAEGIVKHQELLTGFSVPPKELLLILKQQVWQERKLSVKGRKDFIDIMSLLLLPDFNWQKYCRFLKTNNLMTKLQDLKTEILQTNEIKELQLNQHQFSRIKKLWLKNISSTPGVYTERSHA